MTTAVEDIIRAMREQPEVRDQVRRAVLTDELLELPERFATLTARVEDLSERVEALTARFEDMALIVESNTRQIAVLTERLDTLTQRVDDLTKRVDTLTQRVDDLTKRVDDLTKRVDTLTQRVDDLTKRMDVLTARVDTLTQRLDTLTQRVDDLTIIVENNTKAILELRDDVGLLLGDRLERISIRNLPPQLSQSLGLRRARVMHSMEVTTRHSDDFIARIEDAADEGTISEDQEYRLKRTDIIIHSRRKGAGSSLWIAAEVSGTIGEIDIYRAADSAAALKAALGEDTVGVVVGHRIRDEDRARADANGLIVLLEGRDAHA